MASGYPDYTGKTSANVDYYVSYFDTNLTLIDGDASVTRNIISGKFLLKWIETSISFVSITDTFSVEYLLNGVTLFYWRPFYDGKPIESRRIDIPGLIYVRDIKRKDFKATMIKDLYCEGSLTESVTYRGLSADGPLIPVIAYQGIG